MGIVTARTRRLAGPRRKQVIGAGPIVACLVRDGEEHVVDFVEYHLSRGFEHVVLLDNGSTDQTLRLAQSSRNVTCLSNRLRYRRYKNAMKRFLLERFSASNWLLIADIDERFDFPGSTRLSLVQFLAYVEEQGADCVVSHLLDMFPAESLPNRKPFRREDHCYYETVDVVRRYLPEIPFNQGPRRQPTYSGGLRKRLFGLGTINLTKPTLIRRHRRMSWRNPHRVDGIRPADVTAVLLHYKFTATFERQIDRAIAENSYYNNSSEYKAYRTGLRGKPDLCFHSSQTKKLNHVNQLVDEGFLTVSGSYRQRLCQIDHPQPVVTAVTVPDDSELLLRRTQGD